MDIVLMIVYTTILLGFLVFVHEGGHYLAARAFGVRVTEFMLGLPGPSIGFKRGETRFGVTAVPLGGYAKVCGMEAGEMSPHLEVVLAALYRRGTANMEDIARDCGISDDEAYVALEELVEWGSVVGPSKKDQYNTYRAPEVALTRKQRKAMKAAAAASSAAPQTDVSETVSPALITVEVTDRAASAAALAPDPVTTGTSSEGVRTYALGEARPVDDAAALFASEYRQQYRAQPFWKRTVILVAGVVVNLIVGVLLFVLAYSVIGVDLQNTETGVIQHFALGPLQAIQGGFLYIGQVMQFVVALFNPATAGETVSQSMSIIGIAAMSKSMVDYGLFYVVQFAAMISVSLGIMNLLPIPPLDGGRLVIEIFQKISRKVVSARALNNLSLAGMALVMVFFLVIANQDIQRFVFGNW